MEIPPVVEAEATFLGYNKSSNVNLSNKNVDALQTGTLPCNDIFTVPYVEPVAEYLANQGQTDTDAPANSIPVMEGEAKETDSEILAKQGQTDTEAPANSIPVMEGEAMETDSEILAEQGQTDGEAPTMSTPVMVGEPIGTDMAFGEYNEAFTQKIMGAVMLPFRIPVQHVLV